MLERIHHVKGIGLLHDADGRAQTFKKATFIYADNGQGKSTLTSIFRSCSTNNASLILNRRTINGTNAPEVNFQFSNGQRAIFQNEVWDHQRPEILVFDSDFVEKNVYAGGQVTTDHRKNLLQFALGANAVVAQREYDQADANAQTAAAAARQTISQLDIIHQGLTLTQFQQIAYVPDADEQISALNENIVEAQNIGSIQAKAIPQELVLPQLDIDEFFRIIGTSLTNIDLAAEEQVKSHIISHDKPNLEKWISDGHSYGNEETCVYCNQNLSGVQLIQAYRSYFNNDYNQLKLSVARLEELLSTICSDSIIERLKTSFVTASAVIDGWQEHLEIHPPTFNESNAKQCLNEIRTLLDSLKQVKEAQILESVDSNPIKGEILEKWQAILDIAADCNTSISEGAQAIATYKENLAALDIHTLQQQIRDLEWAKTRHRQDIVALLAKLSQEQIQDRDAKLEKQNRKDALNQIMQATLESYKDRINELLRSFGAQFTIPNIDFNYRGGLRSDYALQLRGCNIDLSGGVPDFKTALSEGDKRTLAFAFFIASTETDPALTNKIIVIDDPMCSFDLNRKQQTRIVLKRLHDNCEQLIVLVHDIHFMRNLRDEILRTENENNVKCIKLKSVRNRFTDFDNINVDQECESAYYKCHRILNEYMEGTATSSMEVAKSIRPMLEGYLHRRFPGLINGGILFGDIINLINNAQHPSPLLHAQSITTELNEINRYAGQFHHDTNPGADQVQIVDGELLGFVERATKVIHAGVV